MARKKKIEATEELSQESQAKKKLLQRVLERSKIMIEADEHNRKAAIEDLRFVNVPGEQWDVNMKTARGDRPCLQANTLRINGKRIINEIRSNRPQGHVRAVEGGDKEGAELREGLVRNILTISDFDSITDYAAEYQVDGGLGAWRIDSEYADDSMFDQDIIVKPIKDPIRSLYWDPTCSDILLKRDAEDWLLLDRMSIAKYKAKYGDAEQFDFEADGLSADVLEDWEDEETVRVAEYWYKEPHTKELWLVEIPRPDGSGSSDRLTVDSTSDEAAALKAQGITPTKTRIVRTHKIMMCVASGKSIVEGPTEVAGTMFPFVVAHGEIKVVDGRVEWCGLHRHSKDAQQIQNIFWTAAAETVALAPKAHTWATVKQAEGHLESWARAHQENLPVRLYNADPMASGAPVQHPGAQVPVAMMEMVALSGDLIRTTSGLHEASFGEESNEKSGIALARKQNQAALVTYNFPDNMAKGAKRTGEIILDRIPIVYDAERELRVLGVDGAEDYAKVNHVVFDPATGKSLRINDLTSGKYDYYVKSGPSYSSQREEASEIYGEFVQRFPDLMGVAGDLIFKASDLPYSDEIAKRMQTLLPPQIQQQLAQGKAVPPEVQAAMAQVEQKMQMVQQQAQVVQQAAQEIQKDKTASDQAKMSVDKAVSQLKIEQAQFDADVAKKLAQIESAMSKLMIKEASIDSKGSELQRREIDVDSREKERPQIESQIAALNDRLSEFDALVAQYINSAAQTLQQIDGEVRKPKRRITKASTKREGGKLLAEVQFDDGTTERMMAARENGNLTAVPVTPAPTGVQ